MIPVSSETLKYKYVQINKYYEPVSRTHYVIYINILCYISHFYIGAYGKGLPKYLAKSPNNDVLYVKVILTHGMPLQR